MRSGKRGNGEGSVYQRSDGKWCGALVVAGRRRVIYGSTRQDAAQKLAKAMDAASRGLLRQPSRLTVGGFLDRWLEDTVKPRVRPLTYSGYAVNVRRHIIPALGDVRLDRLSPEQVQNLLNRKLKDGLSSKTVAYIRQVLRTSLDQAMRWNLVSRNVVTLVPAPRKERKVIHPLEPHQVGKFLSAVAGRRLEALYVTTLALGLREGEVLGLQWEDIDLRAGTLRVQRQLQRFGGRLQLVEPKTDRARRVLDLPQYLVKALTEHQKRQVIERLTAGAHWDERGLVFPTSVGTPLEARSLLRDFRQVIRKGRLPAIRFHDLRHSCATMLLVQGVPARVVMEILGHSDISLTMNTYSHVIPGLRKDAAARMEDLLANAKTAGQPRNSKMDRDLER
ncbi:MAG TPA: site-specific integrase [Candidatus Dormibacteraeota bacterium]